MAKPRVVDFGFSKMMSEIGENDAVVYVGRATGSLCNDRRQRPEVVVTSIEPYRPSQKYSERMGGNR
jgi:hypothetical protein